MPQNARNALKTNQHWKLRCYEVISCTSKSRKYINKLILYQMKHDFDTKQTCWDGENYTYLWRQVRVLIAISTGTFGRNSMKFSPNPCLSCHGILFPIDLTSEFEPLTSPVGSLGEARPCRLWGSHSGLSAWPFLWHTIPHRAREASGIRHIAWQDCLSGFLHNGQAWCGRLFPCHASR